MDYKKIKPKKIYEEVAEAINELIRNGDLKPGEKLDSVQQLAENFQVGRSAIREALTSLQAIGLVEMRQGEGTFIKEFGTEQMNFPFFTAILMDQRDFVNLLEVRKIIELGTAAAAAKRRTNQHLLTMERALEDMEATNGDEELGEKADLQFHLAIAEASQNSLLISLINHVSGLMGETMKETRKLWLYSKQTTIEKLTYEHYAIFKAIQKQDEEQARYFMKIHLEAVESVILKYYEQTSYTK